MNDHLVILVTAASVEQARQLARHLLEHKLAACVNLVPVESLYLWQETLHEDKEVLMIIKSRSAVFERLMAAVKDQHSYEVPEIIGMPIVMGSDDYLKWINHEVSS